MGCKTTHKWLIIAAIAACFSQLSCPVIAVEAKSFQIAQASSSAKRLYQEGFTLFKQGSQEAFKQALTKFEAALQSPDISTDLQLQASIYQNIGTIYFTQNNYAKALKAHQAALTRYEQLNNAPNLANQLALTAMTYYSLGEYPPAIALSEQALDILETFTLPDLEATIYTNLGSVYSRLGNVQKSIASFQSALKLYQDQGKIREQAGLWKQIASVHLERGEAPKARNALNQALALSQQIKDTPSEAETLWLLGTVGTTTGDYTKAIPELEKSRQLYQELATSSSGFTLTQVQQGQISVSLSYAIALEGIDRVDRAGVIFQEALSLSRKQGNPYVLAETLNIIGFFQSRQGNHKQALTLFQEALALQQSTQNLPRAAVTLENIGTVYLALGEPQQALDTYQKSLKIHRDLGDRKQEGSVLRALGALYRTLTDYPISIQYYQQAYRLAQGLNDPLLQGQILNDLGEVYRKNENFKQAIASYQQSIDIWRSQQNPFQVFTTYTGLIRALAADENFTQARLSAQQALDLAKQSDSLFQEGVMFSALGRVELLAQRYPEAIQAFQKAQAPLEQGGYVLAQAVSLNGLGEAYQNDKSPQDAIAAHQKALEFFRSSNDPIEIANTLYLLAKAERDQSNLEQAQALIEETLQLVERYRSKLVSPDLRSRYFASVQNYYEFYIDILMQQHQERPGLGYDAQALAANERAKARSLLDLLVESNIDIRQGIDPTLLVQERSLQQQISQKDGQWRQIKDSPDQQVLTTKLQAEIEQLLVQYDALQTQLRQTSPNYAALTSPKPITLTEIQQTVLDDKTALLEYSLGEERSFLWVVTQSGLKSYTLPARAEIETAARAFYQSVTNRTLAVSGIPSEMAGKNLSALILPSELQLSQKRLLIVGDGILQYIPFAALPSVAPDQSSRRLIDRYETITLPSASTLSTLRQVTQNRPVAPKPIAIAADPVFSPSDPRVTQGIAPTPLEESLSQRLTNRATSSFTLSRLPGTRAEAEKILNISQKPDNLSVFDFEANLNQIQSHQFGQFSIVHLATHGIANAQNPELSGLFLSLIDSQGNTQPGFLSLNQIFNLNWPAELVVLSACDTGLGERIRGEGILGLTRGFMYAGSKRVLVSQWSVDDTGTQQLMTAFYDKLLNEKLAPAAALRAAQLKLANDPQWRSPYYWAAFTLQGDW